MRSATERQACVLCGSCAALALAVVCLFAGRASAQQVPIEIADEHIQEPDKNQSNREGVYLNDSFEAREIIREARDFVARMDWPAAVEKMHQALVDFGHTVIDRGDGTSISIERFVNHEVARWPAEGLSAYRKAVEPAAQKLLSEARGRLDVEALTTVLGRYFSTESAIPAADALAEIHLESGRPAQARMIYERLAKMHPDRDRLKNQWLSKLAICRALAGEVEAADALLEREGPSVQQHALDWKGGRSAAYSIVREIEADALSAEPRPPRQAWPTYAGNPSRSFTPRTNIVPTAPLWTFDDFSPSTLSGADGYFQSSSYRTAYKRGKFLALQPAVDYGMVFFNDAVRVWGLHLETGSLVWTTPGAAPAEPGSVWADRSVPPFHSMTVFRKGVYAVLGQRPTSYYGYQPPIAQSLLVCLDATTGKQRWSARPGDHGEDPKEVEFEGPVVVDHSGVFLVARRRKAFGFEDAFLWKFDHAGVLRWRTHLASGSTGGFGYRRATLAIPTLIDGAVLVQTNLGAIASVDAYSGQINWISVYDTARREQRNRWQNTGAHELSPWQYNPMFPIPDRQLLALPLDSTEALILDRVDGRILRRTPVAELHNVRSVLGVVEGRIYAQGDDLFSWDPSSGAVAWSQPLPESPIYGRAALSTSHIYLPCQSGLYTYPLHGGAPQAKPWDHTQEGGNIVILPESILVAGNSRITSYGLRENVFARLQARMDENPRDAWAALNMAEVAYRTAFSQPSPSVKTADYHRAAEALAEAIRRAGGFAVVWDAPFKSRMFRDCLEFADLHLREEPAHLDAAVDMIIKAGLCPPDAHGLLKQKAKLAAVRSRKEDFGNEIREYHHILSDRALRALPWPGTEAEPTAAAEVCRAKIADLIRQHGRKIYRPLDEKASSLLTLAKKDGDLKRLDHIIDVLPNSLAAPKALLAKGALLRDRDNRPSRAMRSYYAALTRYPKLIDSAAEVIKDIALCYVAADRPTAAWEWLTKGGREFPNTRITVQGRSMTFREFRATLGDVERLLHISLPTMGMKLHEGFTLPANAEDRLLYPAFAAQRESDWSRVLVYRNGAVQALDPVSGKEIWPEPSPLERRPRLLAALREVIILTTRFEVLGLQPDTGKVLWRYGEAGEGFDDPAADPEDFPYWRLHRIHENTLISSRSDGHTIRVQLPLGRVVWKQDLKHRPRQAMNVGDHLTVYRAVSDEQQLLVVLSTRDGRVQRTIPLQEERPILRIVPTQAGFVILMTSQSLIAVDPLSGKIEWRKLFDHNFLVDSVHAVLDGVLLSPDSRHIVKLSLDAGRQMWRSAPLGSRQSDLRLFPVQNELYVANDRRVYSLDPATGTDLGRFSLPPGAHLAHLMLTDERLALIGVDSDYWVVSSHRPAELENLLDRQLKQPLGRELGPTEFYFFDYAIIGVSEDAFRGWVSPSESND